MKILLGIILLCAQLYKSQLLDSCPEDYQTEQKGRFDSMRSEFAKNYSIANMNELLIDPSLEKIARTFKSCDDLKDGLNYQIGIALEETNAVFQQFLMETNQTVILGTFERTKDFGLYHPLQTGFIACALTNYCPRVDGEMLYILSPRGAIRKSAIKYGKPGSACTNGTTSDHGLCKVTIDEGLWPFPYYEDEEAEIDQFLESRMNTTVAEVETTPNEAGVVNFFIGFTGLSVAILFGCFFEGPFYETNETYQGMRNVWRGDKNGTFHKVFELRLCNKSLRPRNSIRQQHERRFTIDDALKHEWFKKGVREDVKDLLEAFEKPCHSRIFQDNNDDGIQDN